MDQIKRYTLIFAFIILGVIVLTPVGFVIYYLKDIFFYIIIATVISLMGRPVLRLLDKVSIKGRTIPDSIKAMITLLVIYGLATLLFMAFIPSLLHQTESLENIDVEAVAKGLEEPIKGIENFIERYQLAEERMEIENYFSEKIKSLLTSTRVSSIAGAIVGFTGDLFIAVFAISFIAFFFLKERYLLQNAVVLAVPGKFETKVGHILASIKKLLTRYFLGVIAEILLVGGLIATGLALLGVENAILIGFFAGLFNVIPYLGPIIGTATGLALTILGSLYMDFYTEMVPLLLKELAVFILVQLVDNLVFQPFIYSSSVKAHPLEIFLVILIAGNLAGVGGMILAIPVYTIMRVVAKEFFDQFALVRTITKDI
ncbi:MAG: AI-2E family transporter [Bacteroidia bacterium]